MKTLTTESLLFLAVIAITMIPFLPGGPQLTAQDAVAVRSEALLLKDFVDNCVRIDPGTDGFPTQFQMGRHFTSPFALAERKVEMSHSFRISKFELTQELYAAITGTNPSRWKGPRNSVESMTFLDAEMFCTKLTGKLRASKLIAASEVVRLPSEAEWEYCCRAGTDTLYSFGDAAGTETDREPVASILNDYAWHTGNAAGNDPAVGVLKPNPWGLFDMHGYLWEFVSDKYTDVNSPDTGSTVSSGATTRIIRGGSWRDPASYLTSGARHPVLDHVSSDAIGFRCVIAQ